MPTLNALSGGLGGARGSETSCLENADPSEHPRLVAQQLSTTQPLVEVIVPVHNALEDTRRCLESVLGDEDAPPLRLIVVNDGSDSATTQWLRTTAVEHPSVCLVEHEGNLGYTHAVNTGLSESGAPYVVLLNSDTIVTRGWLQGMIRCAESHPQIGIVGPLSNAASWQSVPKLKDESGGFAINPIPVGMNVQDLAAIVASVSRREYPRTPVLNGFCFMIKRAVIEAIGTMDAEAFPVGYGEENDFCVRAATAGFELAVADDVYVFHAKSKSFGQQRRKQLSRAGMEKLRAKHGDQRIDDLIERVSSLACLHDLRVAVQGVISAKQQAADAADPLGARILFLLPVKAGNGGANSVVQEAIAMRRIGIHVAVAVRTEDYEEDCALYRDISEIETLFVPFTPASFLALAADYDVLIATHFRSIELLVQAAKAYPEKLPAYYVQDYEPLFFKPQSRNWHEARDSYGAIPGALLFAKTDWICERVTAEHGLPVRRVMASLDHDVYYPAPRESEPYVCICAMIRPQTPRRGARRTMRVLREVVRQYEGQLGLHLFGCDTSDPRFQDLPRDFPFVNYGPLSRPEVAELLRQSNVFIDLSDYQAFGRTGLEAMASGCAVVLPASGGTSEYAIDGKNAIIVDSSNESECVRRILALVQDPASMRRLRREGLMTAARYSVHRAAMSELVVLADGLSAHRAAVPEARRRRVALLPQRYRSGSVNAAGHVRLLQAFGSASARRVWRVDVTDSRTLPDPADAGVAIVQRGADIGDPGYFQPWLSAWRKAGGRVVFDAAVDVFDPLFVDDAAALAHDQGCHGKAQWLASVADAVFAPTLELQQALQTLNPNVYLVPSRLDAVLWRGLGVDRRVHASERDQLTRIGLMVLPHRASDLALVLPALQKIQASHGRRVAIEIVGLPIGASPGVGEALRFPPGWTYPEYVAWLQERDWDIGLCPVCQDNILRSSPLPILEYSALGAATIASEEGPQASLIQDGETGLLVPNELNRWVRAMARLIEQPALRRRLADASRERVARDFETDRAADGYSALLEQVLALPPRAEAASCVEAAPGALPEWFTRQSAPEEAAVAPSPPQPMPERVVHAAPLGHAQSSVPKPAAGALTPIIPEALGRQRSAAQRKLDKFRRDPAGFFADSRVPGFRAFARLARGRKGRS